MKTKPNGYENETENNQSKVKESKVKESKDNINLFIKEIKEKTFQSERGHTNFTEYITAFKNAREDNRWESFSHDEQLYIQNQL
jgi:hypothetical protein